VLGGARILRAVFHLNLWTTPRASRPTACIGGRQGERATRPGLAEKLVSLSEALRALNPCGGTKAVEAASECPALNRTALLALPEPQGVP
jgi:hypothetical protein